MTAFTESKIEIFSLDELKRLGFFYIPGPSIAPDVEATLGFMVAEPASTYGVPEKRATYGDVILRHTLEQAINRLNPAVPERARHEALKAALSVFSPQLIDANETFHKMLAVGVPVTLRKDGQERGERVWLVDFQNPADEHATVRKAYDQIQTYKTVIPSLFFYNAFCVISDGLEAKAGTISSAFSRFQTWKTIGGKKESSAHVSQLEVLIRGMLNKSTLLDLIRNFIVFEKDRCQNRTYAD